jgi:hypothetical protein
MDEDFKQKQQENQKSQNSDKNDARRILKILKNEKGIEKNQKRVAGKFAKKIASRAEKLVIKAARKLFARAVVFLISNPEILIPLLIIGIIVIVLIILIFPPPPSANAVQMPCTDIPGASCQVSASSCPAGTAEDTTGTYTCPASNNYTASVCCLPQSTNTASSVFFYCQYGAVNSQGVLENPGSWNTSSCDIVRGGCAPTSIAMITASFGKFYTPTQIAIENNYQGCSATDGVSASDFKTYFTPWLKNRGFIVTNNLVSYGNIPLSIIKDYIDNGYLILGGANVQWIIRTGFTKKFAGHAFVISGVDLATNSLTVYDPTFCEAGHYGGLRTLTDVNNWGYSVNSVQGWIFAFAIKAM